MPDRTLFPQKEPVLSRRGFFELAGAGLMITAAAPLDAQRGAADRTLEARLHIGEDGFVTVLSGKIEEGQGALTELALAASEELRLPVERIRMVLGDTDQTPDDGTTAGSGTTPRTIPQVRKAAAAARGLLVAAAARQFGVSAGRLEVRNGAVAYAGKSYGYSELARAPELAEASKSAVPESVAVTPAKDWQTLGKPRARVDARDLLTGAHRFPSDIVRPGMLYGRVLRPPAYGATLENVDLGPAQQMADVKAIRDGELVACCAPTTFAARKALEAVSATARWKMVEQTASSDNLFSYLKLHAGEQERPQGRGSVEQGMAGARQRLKATYQVAYIQHVPMEPRAAVAEWQDGRLTVWTGTSNPASVRQSLAQALGIPASRVRVLVPHFGGGFGGKHTGEAAVEAARLARAAGRPVAVQWTRAEEFMWAYFRPAALIEVEAGLDANNSISSWDFVNYNSGEAGIDPPYRIPNTRSRFIAADSPLRTGSYRVLAATANNFAREAFLDELAAAAGKDPLEFRLSHLENSRLRDVLRAATDKFGWRERRTGRRPGSGIGLACGTEKNSVVAACCEVQVDSRTGAPKVVEVVQAFECGAILNPANLKAQVEGSIMMGLGPALGEEVLFRGGRLTNARLGGYHVARFRDLPKLEVVLLDRKDLESAGAGETPIIAIAPAIANAVFDATGKRAHSMPVRISQA